MRYGLNIKNLRLQQPCCCFDAVGLCLVGLHFLLVHCYEKISVSVSRRDQTWRDRDQDPRDRDRDRDLTPRDRDRDRDLDPRDRDRDRDHENAVSNRLETETWSRDLTSLVYVCMYVQIQI